jgi:signal transduction histidine kinase
MDNALQVVNAVAFSALALVVLRLWRQQDDAPSAWLSATFGALALVLVVGLFLPEDATGTAADLTIKALVVLIVLYPYFLYRFTRAFGRMTRGMDGTAFGITVAIVAVTLFLPRLPEENDPRPVWLELYALAVVAQWAFLSGVVSARLWRAGNGQPTVTRRRMRMLAVGAVALVLAILPAALPRGGEQGAVQAVAQLLPCLAALLFLTGFAPPAWLRIVWRGHETAALREAEVELMGVVTVAEVTNVLLPHVAKVFGAPGVMLVGGDGRPKATYGLTHMEALELAAPVLGLQAPDPVIIEGQPALLALPLRDGWLVVPASPFAPFFGAEEVNLLKGLGLFTDIAMERAELFQRERDARRAVEETNAELETLVYGVSHDLKSPIITLLGYLEYLRADHADKLDDEGRYFLERMGASATYMQALIQDLLELSRIGRVQTDSSDVDLGSLITEVSEAAREGHPGLVVVAEQLPIVRMNPVRARQLFTNLVENGARHGGRPDVRLRVSARPAGPGLTEISVADDGVGITEPYREKVFGIFERLESRDAATSGTGMGLAICRKIVEQVGGVIGIVPSESGTDIRLTLPLASVTSADTNTVEARR